MYCCEKGLCILGWLLQATVVKDYDILLLIVPHRAHIGGINPQHEVHLINSRFILKDTRPELFGRVWEILTGGKCWFWLPIQRYSPLLTVVKDNLKLMRPFK